MTAAQLSASEPIAVPTRPCSSMIRASTGNAVIEIAAPTKSTNGSRSTVAPPTRSCSAKSQSPTPSPARNGSPNTVAATRAKWCVCGRCERSSLAPIANANATRPIVPRSRTTRTVSR